MVEYNFNFEIASNLAFFQSALDDIVIKRYDHSDNHATDSIKVNVKYAPKSKLLEDLRGQPDTVKFPICAITVGGYGRDNERVKNKNEVISYKTETGEFVNLQAIPWNINVTMHILAKYQEDIDQIIGNFGVLMNPYIIFSWREPKSGRDVRSEVSWDGNVNIVYPTHGGDVQATMPWRYEANATFVIKTYLYRTSVENTKPICKINLDVIPTNKFFCNYESLSSYTKNSQQESFELLGLPNLRYVDDYYFKVGDTPNIRLTGEGFSGIYGLFLSGSNPGMYPITTYYPVTGSNESFNGYAINEFSIPNPQELSFIMPAPSAFGFCDIIAVNSCGWSKLTTDANRCNRVLNPYSVSMPEHYNWCVQQYPYLNGLIISNNLNDNSEISCDDDIITIVNDPYDKTAILEAIKQLLMRGNLTIDELITQYYGWFNQDLYNDYLAYEQSLLHIVNHCGHDDEENFCAING